MNHRIPEELIEFIKESPTAFHAVSAMAARLTESGFIRLEEGMHWNLKQGGSYYVTRNDSSLIAFTIPEHPFRECGSWQATVTPRPLRSRKILKWNPRGIISG